MRLPRAPIRVPRRSPSSRSNRKGRVIHVRRAELVCVGLGGALVVAGVAVLFWPAALLTAGAMLIAVGWPKGGAR